MTIDHAHAGGGDVWTLHFFHAQAGALLTQLREANAYIERIRIALGGYPDSDLASLAETLRQRVDALEAAAAPGGHRHDGGHWIACPFCADDALGMCCACNGTRRIWEMPPDDAV